MFVVPALEPDVVEAKLLVVVELEVVLVVDMPRLFKLLLSLRLATAAPKDVAAYWLLGS